MLRTDPSQPVVMDAPPMSMSVSTAIWEKVRRYLDAVKAGKGEQPTNPLVQHELSSLRMTRSCNLPSDRMIIRSELGTPYSVGLKQLDTLTWDGRND